MKTWNAVVLAGTRPQGDPLAIGQGVSHKGLIEIRGKTLLARVVEAVQAAGAQEVAVSCSDPAIAAHAIELGATPIEAAAGPSASVAHAFARAGPPLVVTTCDHALLQPGWIRHLVTRSGESDVSVMLARREAIERAAPGSRRTYLRFADGEWSGCNLFLLNTPEAARAIDVWKGIEANRKRPWKIVAKLGPATLLDYALRRLSLAEGLARLGRRIGIDAALVEASDGLAAVDVDSAADLTDVETLLNDGEALSR